MLPSDVTFIFAPAQLQLLGLNWGQLSCCKLEDIFNSLCGLSSLTGWLQCSVSLWVISILASVLSLSGPSEHCSLSCIIHKFSLCFFWSVLCITYYQSYYTVATLIQNLSVLHTKHSLQVLCYCVVLFRLNRLKSCSGFLCRRCSGLAAKPFNLSPFLIFLIHLFVLVFIFSHKLIYNLQAEVLIVQPLVGLTSMEK